MANLEEGNIEIKDSVTEYSDETEKLLIDDDDEQAEAESRYQVTKKQKQVQGPIGAPPKKPTKTY